MTTAKGLARWAVDDATWSMLAELAGPSTMNADTHGLDDRTMQRLWGPAKNDVARAAQLVSICRSEKWLRKLAKDRRVKIRQVVFENATCPFDTLDAAAVLEKNWDAREAAKRAINRRVPRLPAEAALALVHDGMSEELLEAVISNPNLSDAEMLRLIGMTLALRTRSSSATRTVEVSQVVASRCDLKRRPDEVLLALAATGQHQSAALAAVTTKRPDVCRALLADLAAAEHPSYRERDTIRVLAQAPAMEREYYEKIVSLNHAPATTQCGLNQHCPWDVLADVPARDTGVHALGRALVERQAPQEVWRLVVELCGQNSSVSVGEVLALVEACE